MCICKQEAGVVIHR